MNPTVGIRKEVITKSNKNFSVIGPGIANRKVAVAKYTVPANTALAIQNGAQLIMKLADGSGNEISRDSYVYFYVKRSGFDGEEFVSKLPYSAFFDLTVAEQRNAEFNSETQLIFAIPKKAIALGPEDELQIWVESADAVDFTNAATLLELEALARRI